MKESYIKLPNITVSKLQDVIDYLDENNIEYIEEYKRDKEIDRLNNSIKQKDNTLKEIREYMNKHEIEEVYLDCKLYETQAYKDILKILDKGSDKE